MTHNTEKPPWTPSDWLNTSMRFMLRTPGVQRLVGRSTALLTFTGRKSGQSFTTPISYSRHGNSVILTGHVSRQWWRNVAASPRVRLRVEGIEYPGTARVLREEEALPYYVELLEDQSIVAKVSGVEIDPDGTANRTQAGAALENTVVVMVDLETRFSAEPPRPAGVGLASTLEAVGLIVANIVATPIVGRRRMRWGTTAEEATSTLPGDELVPEAKWTYTYAVDIDASPTDVWPWIAQIGQGRGGFYSYQTLENLAGCKIHNTAEILTEHQNPTVGDEVYLHPDTPPLSVAIVDPPHAMALHGQPADAGTDDGYAVSTWQFCLVERPDGATRLLTRGRSDYSPGMANRVFFGRFPIEPIAFVMSRKMLLEIKRLAEHRARTVSM